MTHPVEPVDTPAPAILIVEDDPLMATLIAKRLSRDGYVVETVRNGADAMRQLQARAYALIISDIRMPRIDGLDFYRAIEHAAPHLCQRVILITGYPLSSDGQAFEDETGIPILRKPFWPADLLRLVGLMLTGS